MGNDSSKPKKGKAAQRAGGGKKAGRQQEATKHSSKFTGGGGQRLGGGWEEPKGQASEEANGGAGAAAAVAAAARSQPKQRPKAVVQPQPEQQRPPRFTGGGTTQSAQPAPAPPLRPPSVNTNFDPTAVSIGRWGAESSNSMSGGDASSDQPEEEAPPPVERTLSEEEQMELAMQMSLQSQRSGVDRAALDAALHGLMEWTQCEDDEDDDAEGGSGSNDGLSRVEKLSACGNTLEKMLDNIVKNPDEAKFRKIKTSNARFASTVLSVPGSDQFLRAIGFSLQMALGKDGSVASYMILPSDVNTEGCTAGLLQV